MTALVYELMPCFPLLIRDCFTEDILRFKSLNKMLAQDNVNELIHSIVHRDQLEKNNVHLVSAYSFLLIIFN